MKPTVKLAALLGAVVVAGSVSVWLYLQLGRQREIGAATPQPRRAEVSPPAIPLANAKPALAPAAVQTIVAVANTNSYADRVKAIRVLPAELPAEVIQAFFTYLFAPSPASTENREPENWLRNVLMDKLAESPALPAGLVGMLVAIYQDPAQDIVMRDYAVQHLTPVYAQASAEEKVAVQQTLWAAVAETDSSIAGTALLALRDLGEAHPEFEPTKLGAAALKLAEDDRSGELSRITAVQLCGRMGIHQVAPILRQLAQTSDNIPLQIAAIAALGDVGDAAERDYLRQLANQPEPRLRLALETALKKLNRRLGI